MSRLICYASLLLSLLLITATAADDKTSKPVFCGTLTITSRDYAEHKDLNRLHNELGEYVNGCKIVIGDLEINELGVRPDTTEPIDENIRKLNTDFLITITEIRGRLLLRRINVESIVLYSVRVIRGQTHFSSPPYSSSYRYAIDVLDMVHPTTLHLGWLTTIASGTVRIGGSTHAKLYCYLTRMVDWSELFRKDPWDNSTEGSESGARELNVRTADYVTTDEPGVKVPISAVEQLKAMCSRLAKCSNFCRYNNASRRNCWSGEWFGCQILQFCGSRACQTCEFRSNRLTRSCCDSECLGGCSGEPRACVACRNVRTPSGQCKKACNSEETQVHGLKRLGNFCVTECMPPFVTSSDGKHCLGHCPRLEIAVNDVCYHCVSNRHRCTKTILSRQSLVEDYAFFLMREKYPVWETKSYLLVDGRFLDSQSDTLPVLVQLQIFGGDLTFTNFDRSQYNLKLGQYLHNIRVVTGYFVISKVSTTYLGLAKLSHTKFLRIKDVSGLCEAWFPSAYMASRRDKPGQFPFTFENLNFDNVSETCRSAACHHQCRGQCWGPGRDMCVAGN